MQYDYRTSALKKQPGQAVILAARLKLSPSTPAEVQAKMDEFVEKRRRTQPPGASLGSMFKNPPGDYAGRLIEAAGSQRHPRRRGADQPGARELFYQRRKRHRQPTFTS